MTMKRFTYFILAAAVLFFCACESPELTQDPVEVIPQDQPTLTTIVAGFETPDTKSVLHVESSTFASVYWKSGDSFLLYSMNSGGGTVSSPAVFTTTFSGDPKAQATFNGTAPGALDYYLATYPVSAASGVAIVNETAAAFGILPKEQTATAGSYDPAANLAFAYSPAASGYSQLTFHNATTLLKVRVTGSKVATLDSIRVQNTDFNMAGEISMYNFDSSIQIYKNWVSDANSRSVTLKGSFIAGTDYYIAVAPGNYNNLSVIFFFSDHSTISKTLGKATVLTRSTVRNLGTFNMDEASNLYIYNKATAVAPKPVTLCVIPDGYTSGQRTLFESRAKEGMDYMFSVDPYKSYKEYFNVYFIWTPSAEEGATITDGNGHPITVKNTAFSSQWGPKYSDMEANANAVFSFVEANCPEIIKGTLTYDDVPVLILINDTRYGGRAHNYSNGRTYCMVPFIQNGDPQSWSISTTVPATTDVSCVATEATKTLTTDEMNDLYGGVGKVNYTGDWRNVLLHEFGGHSFGRLNDEYWSSSYEPTGAIEGHSWSPAMGLNVTGTWYAGEAANLPSPWKELMGKKASLVSENAKYGRIGVFHGGDVSLFNRWRSEMVSCMIDNRPYFSTLQRILIAKRIIEKSGGTFNLDTYLATDQPNDPVRDGGGLGVILPSTKATVTARPMLPPPVFHTDW